MPTEVKIIRLGDMPVEVRLKDIKNVHLSVYPPNGKVRISAPLRMELDTIRVFAISKLGWIRQQQRRLRSQERETQRDYVTRESHYYLGRRYLLKVVEEDARPKVMLRHGHIELYVRPDTDAGQRHAILAEWYRLRLREILPEMIARLEKRMGVEVREVGIKKMKTRWGTCNRQAGRIWINLELAKKPVRCLDYILAHEMTHLLERRHNERFVGCMDKFMPQWRIYKEELNRFPISHVDWNY